MEQQIYVDVGSDHINLLRCWAIYIMKCKLDVEEMSAESEPEGKSQLLIPALSVVSIYHHYKSWQKAF